VAGFTLFQTSIGLCGLAWNARGITFVQLPEESDAATRSRLRQHVPDLVETTPPGDIARAIDAIVSLLSGARSDLHDVVVDLDDKPAFHRRVYDLTRAIPPGQTRTYGEIATALGDAGASRAVGQALGQNPVPLIVPCHRVLAANGQLGGFSANGGAARKTQLLEIEGALPRAGRLWDL
jgi:methylated-DNA-[protein]-cysteine S-methyltransferase